MYAYSLIIIGIILIILSFLLLHQNGAFGTSLYKDLVPFIGGIIFIVCGMLMGALVV